MFEFRSLPPGTYEVRAHLIGTGGAPREPCRQHDQRHRERRGALITELRTERPAFDGGTVEDRSLQSSQDEGRISHDVGNGLQTVPNNVGRLPTGSC